MARNILTTLKTEHDDLRQLFERMDATTDRARKTRGELLKRIEAGLVPHAKWEEHVFYPAFKERADRDGIKTFSEAMTEHKAVETSVIPDVKTKDLDSPEFAGAVKVFGEMIDHHATEEENTMFRMARKLFSAAELAQLDEDYEAWKQSAVGKATVFHEENKAGLKAVVRSILSPE